MPERTENTGHFEHTRRMFEELRQWTANELKEQAKETNRGLKEQRDYTDARNNHRRAAIDMMADTVATHEAELLRGEERPGWVHTRLKSLEGGQLATTETLKWQNRLLFATLLGLLANLAAPLLGR